MEYVGLFLWFSLCLSVGALIHRMLASSLSYRLLAFLSVPGVLVRKLSQSVVALVCGSTITKVRIYEVEPRDIGFEARGASTVAKALVPLVPLFGCAMALAVLNTALGSPLNLGYRPPALASLDGGGLRGFFQGAGVLLADLIRQGIALDWRNPNLYIFLALTFSLALGSCAPFNKLRDALIGAALFIVALALVSGLTSPPGPEAAAVSGTSSSAGWVLSVEGFVLDTAGLAFVMTVYGILLSLVAAFAVRMFELATKASPRSAKRNKAEFFKSENKSMAA